MTRGYQCYSLICYKILPETLKFTISYFHITYFLYDKCQVFIQVYFVSICHLLQHVWHIFCLPIRHNFTFLRKKFVFQKIAISNFFQKLYKLISVCIYQSDKIFALTFKNFHSFSLITSHFSFPKSTEILM